MRASLRRGDEISDMYRQVWLEKAIAEMSE